MTGHDSGPAVDQEPEGGVLVALWQRMRTGELGAAAALAQAAAPETTRSLTPDQVRKISAAAYRLTIEGSWQEGVALQKLLLAAVAAAPHLAGDDGPGDLVRGMFVEIATGALCQVADPRLYHEALAAGTQVCDRARATGDCQTLGNALHSLGVLHLDPWGAQRDHTSYAAMMREWLRRGEAGMTWDGTAFPMHPDGDLPDPDEAIRTAEAYLRLAARIRTGAWRGKTLKALAQAIAWRPVVGLSRRTDAVVRAARGAAADLDPWEDLPQYMEALAFLDASGTEPELGILSDVMSRSLDELVATRGAERTADVLRHLTGILMTRDPQRALELVNRARPLFATHAPEPVRTMWYRRERAVLKAGHRGDAAPADSPMPLRQAAQQVFERAGAEAWDRARLAVAVLDLAERSPQTDDERFGLFLIDHAERIAPLTFAPFADALRHLRATLWLNEGVNAYNGERWSEAMDCYARSFGMVVELRLRDVALEVLDRIRDVAQRGGPEGAQAVVPELWPLAARIETQLGERGLALLADICNNAVVSLGTDRIDPTLLYALWQMAKSRRFGRMLAAGAAHRWTADETAASLLEAMNEVAQENASTAEHALGDPLEHFSEMLLIAPLTRGGIALGGDTPDERLANLRARFDVHIDDQLADAAADDAIAPLRPEDLRSALDDRTVLLEFFITRTRDELAVLQLVLADDDLGIGRVSLGPATAPSALNIDGVQLEISGLGAAISQLRGSLQADPEPGSTVSAEAAAILRSWNDRLLGGVRPMLDALQARGKSHLCIVPHGPLHFLPFHLLGTSDRPLAADWTVSYLPSIRLMLSQRGGNALRRHRDRAITAIGLGFESGAFGLDPIPEAVREAARIAGDTGGVALLDAQATEDEVLAALQRSRFVHIATHGAHDPAAAAFQCLFLAPGGSTGGDGRLYAHELLAHDLRGLELVTLSACETALGRFDRGDNLRGLPAMLLLAGAGALVGTLWPVETEAAERFFTTLYRRIAAGDSRLDAFASAQRTTREHHPEHRDWGAFYYAGDWS